MGVEYDDIDKIYSFSKLFTSKEIKLSAWSHYDGREVLALYMGSGDFLFYIFTDDKPILKQVPWISEIEYAPVSLCFNPTGSFLLILSQPGHLFLLPILSLIELDVKSDNYLDTSDLTVYSYPFPQKNQKQQKAKVKSPNSSMSTKSIMSCQSSGSSSSSDTCKKVHSSTSSNNSNEGKTNENLLKLKEAKLTKTDIEPTCVIWWQNGSQFSKPTGVIGTKTGEIIFVDLSSGTKIGGTSVSGHIKQLAICQDTNYEFAFLLITLENKVQYKVILEQKDLNFSWPSREYCSPFDDNENIEDGNSSAFGKGNYLPTARSRLQGLKQLSVEKIANLKQKLAESRLKPVVKEDITEDYTQKINSLEPDYVWGTVSDVILSPQVTQNRNVMAGYHQPTQSLSIHAVSLESIPLCTYKMPADAEDVLLCDTVFFTVSTNRTVIQVVSCNVSQIKNSCWDFNPDSILGKWDLSEISDEDETEISDESKPDLIPEKNGNPEKIIGIYKRRGKQDPCDFAEEYNIEKKKEDWVPHSARMENCVVVTNRGIYLVDRKWSVVRLALNWVLRTNELEKVEKLCGIFKLNLGKLLELAGDIKLANSDVNRAIAFYRVSECGLLKIAVKLSAGGHCAQLLKYSVPLMSESAFSDMSLTERIHLSNLVLMAYTQQILSKENNAVITNKFLEFLQINPYYDGILAVSVTGQSFLFKCLHKLIIHKGLILDGYTVLINLIQRFLDNKSLQWTVNKDDFWICLTENCLIEAMIYETSSLPVFVEYVIQNVESLDLEQLERLLLMTDPTSPYVRSVAYTTKALDESYIDNDEAENVFPFQKLVELFLVALLVKIKKFRDDDGYDRDLLLPPLDQSGRVEASSSTSEDEGWDNISEQIWPIRKGAKESELLKRKRESILSCGFGHSALVRNGSVYTWGQTAKGCLGHGPTISKYSSPAPITWLGAFKLEVTIVSCGKQHTVALTNNGLYAWGCSFYGQLGLGEVKESPHPRLISSLANENIISVRCGQYHTLALTSRGSVFAWGWGVHGQLGLGTIDDERIPKSVRTLEDQVIIEIAAGHGHSLVLSDKGHVYSFGSSVYGQLGNGTVVKSSVPVFVKGIPGHVTDIATGYFHNLALTDSNALYTWGISPLSLRRRRQRMLESEKSNTASPTNEGESSTEGTPEEVHSDDTPEIGHCTTEKTEAHLSPTLVDTWDVKGKIVQICCGCHHSVLVTDSGSLYTWGRSVGQVENLAQREMIKPTIFNFNNIRVDAVACGSEFTAVQDKRTGKVYNWGNNSVGQLGVPVEESATKCLDGKLIMLKSNKRTVRIPQTSTISFMSPREVPDIPSSSFTYQTLNKHSSVDSFSLSQTDPDGYSSRCLHFAIEKYRQIYNVNFILKKCIEFGNYQAASKIALLENKFKQSMIYQLKGLQNIPKYHPKSLMSFEKQEAPRDGAKSPKSEVATPDSEIHLFTEQGGKEELCDNVNSEDDVPSQKDSEPSSDDVKSQEIRSAAAPEENYLNQLKTEYVEHAKYILETYLEICLNHYGNESSLSSILETGIQFWTAEKLPLTALEDFLLQKMDLVYYDLGYLLFCQLKRDSQAPILQQFSSTFLLKITSKVVGHIEKNGSCFEYLETMSKIILSDKPEARSIGKRRSGKKPETFVQAITEKLKKQTRNENYLTVPATQILPDFGYYFSCGHSHSPKSLVENFKLFDRISDTDVTDKLIKLYDVIDKNKSADVSCPSCVYNYIKK